MAIGVEGGPISLEVVNSISISSGASAIGYFIKAKKTWLLGKFLGLEYEGTNEEAIWGLRRR